MNTFNERDTYAIVKEVNGKDEVVETFRTKACALYAFDKLQTLWDFKKYKIVKCDETKNL